MAEYIDKNKILDRLDRLMHIATEPPMDADDKAQWVLLRELHKEFSELPTADVEEVKHGEWKEVNQTGKNSRHIKYTTKICSICGYCNGRRKTKRCPNCGARMDGGRKNDLY